MEAILVLEDKTVFRGKAFGGEGEAFGEIIFNTSMTGYQEVLTDPSYKGQIVCMTYPLIGNYGVNRKDIESKRPTVEGFVVKELSKLYSNWRAEKSLDEYLKENNILGIEGVDTRSLTLHIREVGAMRAVISTNDFNIDSLIKKVRKSPSLIGRDLVKEVTTKKKFVWDVPNSKYKIGVIDCGVKYSILKELLKNRCKIIVFPAFTSAEEILEFKPDGILISNGPADPAPLDYIIKTVQKLIGKLPIFGICLGHQILGLAFGGKTYKLKFGHHGGNHPVKDLKTDKIFITVQNHGFCVDINTLPKKEIEITHINLNDQTLEGIRHKKLPIFSVQFHPEAGPGPNDAKCIFNEFIQLIKDAKKNRY
ncbi:MAG: glutamine-hydrolyzing carbamoyl-phosphate synthase small subunit [Candidatus Omnitrophica bacterium]|nr:glutamine-hydrolyzing carbamoyl-phosphate synthase small subunit [Candidatus Omnitrophota bacterium]MCM8831025.1 glutamine-hydrolyzing carbamoyl-phosphate synthase small subunit [Candidatus Omnitrophota bacterium]